MDQKGLVLEKLFCYKGKKERERGGRKSKWEEKVKGKHIFILYFHFFTYSCAFYIVNKGTGILSLFFLKELSYVAEKCCWSFICLVKAFFLHNMLKHFKINFPNQNTNLFIDLSTLFPFLIHHFSV